MYNNPELARELVWVLQEAIVVRIERERVGRRWHGQDLLGLKGLENGHEPSRKSSLVIQTTKRVA